MAKNAPRTIQLSDYDKIISMTDLEARHGTYHIKDIVTETREIQNQQGNAESALFASFVVLDAETGEWLGDVNTRGVVARQLARMIEHGLPEDAIVGPLVVVKGGQNGRSLFFRDSDEVPF